MTVLSIAPGDEDAIRCKVVALIKADNIEGALSAIETYKKSPVDFNFFKVGWKFEIIFPPLLATFENIGMYSYNHALEVD